ncbi:cell wall-binding repeat-containing protein [Phycicoccus sp. BSK3Z-2]|uniref:Cell wall-binding repeat-containing protein n=1 Tax=Phycicoccus avicenniae TaxID=2828860 RepID=A0A941D4U4_9MICO|nr:cell wall-binding repeat-containing protein [Phycicoccus avicenniae]MBR7742119.1 cell wall-binding repeat-containing protein [Phycicoccus avicenniae]
MAAATCLVTVGSATALAAPTSGLDGGATLVTTESVAPAEPAAATGSRAAVAAAVSPSAVQAGLPGADNYLRISGKDRYAAAVAVSKASVCARTATSCDGMLGGKADPVDIVFVASGAKFPDALGAGPLAYGIGPLLLTPGTGVVPRAVITEIERIQPRFVVVLGGTATISDYVERQLAAVVPEGSDRIEGANRYAVAAQVARYNDELWRASDDDQDGKPDGKGVETVVLASGEIFADALGGGGAAANSRGALLLTKGSGLPNVTRSALRDLKPKRVIIVGGTASVSGSVATAVRETLPTTNLQRASGADRYEAAVNLSKMVFGTAEAVVVVSGKKFPDALSSAPLAGLARGTTLLSSGACVSAGTKAEASRVGPTYVMTVGGTASVSEDAAKLDVC